MRDSGTCDSMNRPETTGTKVFTTRPVTTVACRKGSKLPSLFLPAAFHASWGLSLEFCLSFGSQEALLGRAHPRTLEKNKWPRGAAFCQGNPCEGSESEHQSTNINTGLNNLAEGGGKMEELHSWCYVGYFARREDLAFLFLTGN